MLTQIADGVWVHESDCIQSNTVVVRGSDGVLLVDPGLTNQELEQIAADIPGPVVAGFSTHPDWDHVLWHPSLGDAPRYGTAPGAAAMAAVVARPNWQAEAIEGFPPEIADDVPTDLFGLITALPEGADRLPWNGPIVRILEHRGHAVGHAALLIESARVLVAGDMLSDVLVPMPDLYGDGHDPLGDYLAGLDLLESVAGQVEVVVPGHGSVGDAAALAARIDADRAYVIALRDGVASDDPRIGPNAREGWEWVAWIHEGNVEALTARG